MLWFGVCTDDGDTPAGAEGDSTTASSAGNLDKSAPPVPVHNPCKYIVANNALSF